MELEPYKTLAEFMFFGIGVLGATLFIFSLLNLPVLIMFFVMRRRQINNPHFDWSTTLPSHVALNYFCTILYGLIYPVFFFLMVRSHVDVFEWEFEKPVNAGWSVTLGAIVMAWLATRVIQGILNGDRPRFGGWLDRILATIGLLICLRYHSCLVPNDRHSYNWMSYLFKYGFPQMYALGPTTVYGLALTEALRSPKPYQQRFPKLSFILSATCILIVLSPLWLAVPKVKHRDAIALIESNRDLIMDSAKAADLNPRLLAAVIYVAQTRDHPRWTGKFIEKMALATLDGHSEFRTILPDPRMGILPLRVSEKSNILQCIENNNGFEQYIGCEPIMHSMSFSFSKNSPINEHFRYQFPEVLVDLIQSSPAMDNVFKAHISYYEKHIRDTLRSFVIMNLRLNRYELIVSALELSGLERPMWPTSYLTLNTDNIYDVNLVSYAKTVDPKDWLFHPHASNQVDLVLFPPDTYWIPDPHHRYDDTIYSDLMKGVFTDDQFTIPLGTAMLKVFDEQARSDSPDEDRIESIIRRCPYARPKDFARRVKAIMNSPEFDKIFNKPVARKEASR